MIQFRDITAFSIAILLSTFPASSEELKNVPCRLINGSLGELSSACNVDLGEDETDLVTIMGEIEQSELDLLAGYAPEEFIATFDRRGELGLLVGSRVFVLEEGAMVLSQPIEGIHSFKSGLVVGWGQDNYQLVFD